MRNSAPVMSPVAGCHAQQRVVYGYWSSDARLDLLQKRVDGILAKKWTRISAIIVAWKGAEVRPYPDAVHRRWPDGYLEQRR